MWVRQNESTKSIRLNICLLMFKCPVTYIIVNSTEKKERPSIPDYRKGNKVHADILRELILIRGENDYNPPPKNDKFRPIRDAVRDINDSAKNNLRIKIFEYKDQEVRIVKKE